MRVESGSGAVLLESGVFFLFLHLFPVHCALSPFPLPALRTGRAVFPHPALQMDHAARTRITMLRDVSYARVHITRQHPDFRIVRYQTSLRPDNSAFPTVPSLMHVQTPDVLTYSDS